MGKLDVSHRVIHENLKLPITRELGAFNNLVQPKKDISQSSSSNSVSILMTEITKTTRAAEARPQGSENEQGPSLIEACSHSTCSDDSGIMMSELRIDENEGLAAARTAIKTEQVIEKISREHEADGASATSTTPAVLVNGIASNEVLIISGDSAYHSEENQHHTDHGESDGDNISNKSEDDTGISMKKLGTDSYGGSCEMRFDPANLSADSFRQMLTKKIQFLENQVAGHVHGGKAIGLIKTDDGKVLKPLPKKDSAEREVEFYEKLQETVDPDLVELRELIPKYFGTKMVEIDGVEYNSIIMEDLTRDYKQPCIIDIKIGKRTWDPLASPDKIRNEEMKYAECKRDLGFCIPGFQVYNVQDNQLYKFDKNYGKNLNKDTAKDALKTFLNGDVGFCRNLLVQILGILWRIEAWARKQRAVRLFSSSILIVYEARRLREQLKIKDNFVPKQKLTRSKSLYRPLSLAVLNNNECERIQTGFSGQLTKDGPILQTRSFPSRIKEVGLPVVENKNNTWKKSMNMLKRTHSFQNDYDKEVQDKKQDYTYMLDELVCEETSEIWATVKMIDFAHVFPGENCDIDRNYLQGISSLVKIFEDFLADSE